MSTWVLLSLSKKGMMRPCIITVRLLLLTLKTTTLTIIWAFYWLTQNRYEDAISSYMQALRFNPEKKGARANIGAALLQLGKFDEAIRYFQEELKIDPGNEAVRNFMGAAIAMKNAAK